MDWILEHLQLVIFIAGAIAYWLNQTRKGWAQSGEEDVRETRQPHSPIPQRSELDNAEHVRRVQEEIRRKIAERRAAAEGRVAPPPMPAPAAEANTPWAPGPVFAPAAPPPMPAQPPLLYSEEQDAEAVARQRRLSEQLAEAELARVEAKRRLEEMWDRPFSKNVHAPAGATLAVAGPALTPRQVLRDRAALRRAWIMREVLEKPVALR